MNTKLMDEFIEGLQLIRNNFLKDVDHGNDVYAEHDEITVWTIDWDKVKAEDVRKMEKLGFIPGTDGGFDNIEEFLADEGLPLPEGEYFDWEKVTDEQWEVLKNNVDDCFTYYC